MAEQARRPAWLNDLHDRAMAALSSEWQRATDLMRAAGVTVVAFEDLVVAQHAQVRRDPLLSATGHPAGEATYFRASNYWLDHCYSCGVQQPGIGEDLCAVCLARGEP